AALVASLGAEGVAQAAAPAGAVDAPAAASAPVSQSTARVFASPLARRLARERGIDLSGVSGSGPRGRIVKRDLDAMKPVPAAAVAAAASPAGESAYREIPHSGMRRTIARRLSESKATIPHFYLSVDCRVDRLLALRGEFNASAPRKVSINDFIVRAVALALREVPEANVAWTDTALRQFAHADIAIAVATDEGLITPIVRAADTKSVSAISAEIADLAERARAGRLKPSEYQGGSFSVSNLGMYGVDEFAAIVNPPQAAILAVGAVQQKPVVENGALACGSVLRCTLSVDHRAIDGALAGRWLAEFRRVLEAPLSLLSVA
ncbi:MAG TPA: 2-oxo acid dehydrogenase subunit E2, partial [Luteimonas sp.]|nr:2-oxo acid dehydrogenase subunit E2 [Luteimonas sp.]